LLSFVRRHVYKIAIAIAKITNLVLQILDQARDFATGKPRWYFAFIFPTTLARNPSLSRRLDDDRWRCALIDVRNLISEMRQREEESGKCMRLPVARLARKRPPFL